MITDYEELKQRLTAPPGKFRLVAIDEWAVPGEADILIGDFDDIESARQAVKKYSWNYYEFLVYDDSGKWVGQDPG